jgi:hypothetical protein
MTDELLREIRDELRLLRSDLAGRRPQVDQLTSALVRCITDAAGTRPFSAWELVEHSRLPLRAGLRAAMAAAGAAENCRRVGKLLKRVEGLEVDGRCVVRVGADREGAIWQVQVS